MADWQNANGLQLLMIQDALLDAFPDPDKMEMLLDLRLGQRYPQLVKGNTTYDTAIYQILSAARANNWLGSLIAAAQLTNAGNLKLRALRPLTELTAALPPAGRQLEDIVRIDGALADVIPWIEWLNQLRSQVCRIENPVNQASGTGWLVGPDLVMTNWHVIRKVLAGTKKATDVACRFDYVADSAGTNPGVTVPLAASWCVDSSQASPSELGTGPEGPSGDLLDYALLRLAKPVGADEVSPGHARGWIKTPRNTPTPPVNSIVFVLQHPDGDPLKLAIGIARGDADNGTRVLHDANTLGGSSGSPCFNAKLELVALHNAGDPLYDGVIGSPAQNQAVPIEPILAKLESHGAAKFWS
jgi:hypothetical protein